MTEELSLYYYALRNFFKFIFESIYLAVLGLHCCSGFSLVVASRGYSLVAVLGLLIVVASLITEHGCRVCRLQ